MRFHQNLLVSFWSNVFVVSFETEKSNRKTFFFFLSGNLCNAKFFLNLQKFHAVITFLLVFLKLNFKNPVINLLFQNDMLLIYKNEMETILTIQWISLVSFVKKIKVSTLNYVSNLKRGQLNQLLQFQIKQNVSTSTVSSVELWKDEEFWSYQQQHKVLTLTWLARFSWDFSWAIKTAAHGS